MDAESFKMSFCPTTTKLYSVAYRLLENAVDAGRDLVQEAYLELWDKREGLMVISNPESVQCHFGKEYVL